jgi:hypothetical protein
MANSTSITLQDDIITGGYKEIARIKLGDMDKGRGNGQGLEVIVKEFSPLFDCVKPLCKAIRDVLFLYRASGL